MSCDTSRLFVSSSKGAQPHHSTQTGCCLAGLIEETLSPRRILIPGADLLAKHIHGNGQRGDASGGAGHGAENDHGACRHEPLDHGTQADGDNGGTDEVDRREGLGRVLRVAVNNVRDCDLDSGDAADVRNGHPDKDPSQGQSVLERGTKTDEAGHCNGGGEDEEDETEFGFYHSFLGAVVARHEADGGVGEPAEEGTGEEADDEEGEVGHADFAGAEVVWGCGEEDGHEGGHADEEEEDGGVEEAAIDDDGRGDEAEGLDDSLEEGLIGEAAVEEGELLAVRLLCGYVRALEIFLVPLAPQLVRLHNNGSDGLVLAVEVGGFEHGKVEEGDQAGVHETCNEEVGGHAEAVCDDTGDDLTMRFAC